MELSRPPLAPLPAIETEAVPLRFLADIAELLFAARDLVRIQFSWAEVSGPEQRQRRCTECRFLQSQNTLDNHDNDCRTGRVAAALSKLLEAHEGFLSQSPSERRLREETPIDDLSGRTGALLSVGGASVDAARSAGNRAAQGGGR